MAPPGTFSTNTRERSAVAMRANGWTYREIARALSATHSTVYRWCNPDAAESQRRQSREAKRRRTGTCNGCGCMTGYNGKRGKPVSDFCADCWAAKKHDERIWTQAAIVAAFQDFASRTGRSPTAVDTHIRTKDPSTHSRYSPARLTEVPLDVLALLPHPAVAYREFGSWNAAVLAAGLTPQRSGRPSHRAASPRKGSEA